MYSFDEVNWDEVLKDADRCDKNHARRFRHWFESTDAMGEEFVYQKNINKEQYSRFEHDTDTEEVTFMISTRNTQLGKALKTLTKKQLRAIELYYWQGFKQWEIGEIMSCEESTVSRLINRAITRLREYMNK